MLILSSMGAVKAQLNTERIMNMGRNALYFEDYVLSIQYFNLVISAKPFLADPHYFRAISKYYLEDYTGAILDCDKALEIDPFLVGAYELRGIAYLKKAQYSESILSFTKGLKYDKENYNIIYNLGLSYLSGKYYDDAIEQYDRLLAIKKHYMTYLLRGSANLEKGDTTQALEDYTNSIAINPFYAESYSRRALLYLQKKQYYDAELDYDKALELEPRDAGLYLNRGVVQYRIGDLEGAIRDYTSAIKYDSTMVKAYSNRASVRAYIGDDNNAIKDYSKVLEYKPDDYASLLNRALLFNGVGQYDAAIADLSKIILEYPTFPDAYIARAKAKEALGQSNSALRDNFIANKLYDENSADYKGEKIITEELERAKALQKTTVKEERRLKNYKNLVYTEDKEASKYDNKIRGKVQNQKVEVQLQGDFYFSFYQYRGELERQDYFLKPLEDYNHGRAQNIFLTSHNIQLSRSEIGERFVSIDALSTALHAQDDALMYLERGMNYSLVKNFADALNDLNRANELKPNDVVILFSRASVRQRMVDFIRSIEAEEEPEKIEELAKKDNSRIIDYDLIVADYNKAISLYPRFAFAWYNKGNVMNVLKNYKAAVNDYTRAIAIEPRLAEAYYNRGLTYIFLGENELGLKDLSKAGELGIYKAYNVMKRYGN